MIKIGAKHLPRSIFQIWESFGGKPKFRRVWGRTEADLKSNEIGKLGPGDCPHSIFGGGTSEEAGPG